VIGLTWGSILEFKPERIGIALLILGAMLVCYQKLDRKNLASNEIFNEGRERGEADGYDHGYRDGLVDGRRERPHVIELHPKCEDCGQPAAKRPVGSVADRG